MKKKISLEKGLYLSNNIAKTDLDRVENLRSYDILDTPPDESYQNIVSLAAAICQTPLALISFIDLDRQWFKANVGMKGALETPREVSFCTYAIEEDNLFIVEDALKDDRFKNNPAVTGDPFIRFYAGAQIKTSEGYNVGTLCVAGQNPIKLSNQQKDALQVLASRVAELLTLRRVNKELQASKQALVEHQELLISKARHQSIGELAGGICHQINNPLAIIVGRSMILRTLLKEKLSSEDGLLKELDVIDQTSQRVSGILKALRSYSKDLGTDISVFNVFEMIEDALTLLKNRVVSSRTNVVYDRGDDIFIKANRNQLGQAVLDLLNNSLDSLESSVVKNIKIIVEDKIDTVYIRIQDSGPGILPENKENVFKPFFSTKSRHFGVGLTNAQSFIQQNSGELILENLSDPTIFSVKLPKQP
jgi:two-component system, NtrC family, sensor kinase